MAHSMDPPFEIDENPRGEKADKTLWKILLIEDDEDDYLITQWMLSEIRGAECDLEWVSSMDAGREALQTKFYDAVLVDYDLGLDLGLDLIREAVSGGYKSPIILLTGHGSYEVDVKAMQAGATLYLTKEEVKPLLLERTIRYAIEYKRVLQDLQEARDGLELKVLERTAEIEQINHELRAEIATRKSTEEIIRLQSTALEAAADGILITDRDGIIRWCNPALTAMTGYPALELIGRTPALFKSDRHSQEYFKALWHRILSGQIWRGETYNQRKDGTLYIEEQTITPVLDGEGRISNFIAIKHDITDRKNAEEKLENAYRMAETLRSASLALSHSLDMDIVIRTMLDSVELLVPEADRVFLLTMKDACLQVKMVRGKNLKTRYPDPERIEPGEYPLIQEVLKAQTACLVDDTSIHPLWKPVLKDVNTQSWLGVPILVAGSVFGVCCLETETQGSFTQQHIHLTEALLGSAAIAIENARLYQEVLDGRKQHQALSRKLVEIQEMERRYIARELHDETSQALIGLVFALDILKREAGDRQAVNASVDELERLIGDILDKLHQLAVDLRPTALDHLGLFPAIRQYVAGINEKYKLEVKLHAPELPDRLSPDMETNLFRIIQEALANAVRHAHATEVEVRIEFEQDKIRASIHDNGSGFDLSNALAAGRLGLFGMRERAEMSGGTLTIDTTPGGGTYIYLEAPCVFSNIDRR